MARDPVHPGETLKEDLDALGMSAAELARRIGVPADRIARILDGRSAIAADGRYRAAARDAISGPPASSGSTSRNSTNYGSPSRKRVPRSPACRHWRRYRETVEQR